MTFDTSGTVGIRWEHLPPSAQEALILASDQATPVYGVVVKFSDWGSEVVSLALRGLPLPTCFCADDDGKLCGL